MHPSALISRIERSNKSANTTVVVVVIAVVLIVSINYWSEIKEKKLRKLNQSSEISFPSQNRGGVLKSLQRGVWFQRTGIGR